MRLLNVDSNVSLSHFGIFNSLVYASHMSDNMQNRKRILLQKLIEARKEANLTQQEAASKLDKPQSFISKIESGERNVDFLELEDIAKVYDKLLGFFQTNNKDTDHESN